MTGTVGCVTAAIVVLNITLYQLGQPDTSSGPSISAFNVAGAGGSGGVGQPDNTTLSKSPHVPVVISFVALSLAGLFTFLALSFYIMGNGVFASIKGACFGLPSPNVGAGLLDDIEV